MAAAFDISIGDITALYENLQRVSERFPGRVGRALRAEAEIEMTEAKKRCPWKTGALRGSGIVTGPNIAGDELSVTLSFGEGPSASYAVEIHENLEMHHPHGQAKFLESVILESAPYLPQRVAERIEAGAGEDFAPSQADVNASERASNDLDESMS